MMRRLPFLAFLLFVSLSCAHAEDADFRGVWIGWVCPSGLDRDSGKCSDFVLELHQKDGRVCGAHFFANPDASDVDEGEAPSIFGDIDGDSATVVATSGRGAPPPRIRARLTPEKSGSALRWKRLDKPTETDLLPESVRLTKSRSKTLFAPVFAQALNASCTSAFVMAEQRAAQAAAPGGPPGTKPLR